MFPNPTSVQLAAITAASDHLSHEAQYLDRQEIRTVDALMLRLSEIVPQDRVLLTIRAVLGDAAYRKALSVALRTLIAINEGCNREEQRLVEARRNLDKEIASAAQQLIDGMGDTAEKNAQATDEATCGQTAPANAHRLNAAMEQAAA